MRKQIAIPILLISLLAFGYGSAQVKIGDNPQTIDPASVLELESTDRVLVITRVDSLQMASIVPSPGALVYNTSADCVFYYNGTVWINLCGGGAVGGDGEPVAGFTTDPIVNEGGVPTIVITPTDSGGNIEIAPNSITSDLVVDGGINGIDIQNGSIGRGKLQNNSVDRTKLAENSVGPFAIDNDSIDLADFNNATGFIREADVEDLRNSVDANIAAIAADLDTDATNEIQTLSFDETTRTIALSNDGGSVTLPTGAEEVDGDITNELITASVVNGTTLTITQGGNQFDIPLADLEGLGGGGAGGDDNQTAAEVPVAANPLNYAAAAADVEAHLVGIDAALASAGGGGGDDNQTAAEVPFTPTGTTVSENVQAAIEELQSEVDNIVIT
ncbi:MAG: hypothetical protein WA913_13400, partial [Pricia sp.]